MFNKLLVITWFLLRPTFYKYFIILIIRKFLPNRDTQKDRLKAKRWCEKNSISYLDALKFLGINDMILFGISMKKFLYSIILEVLFFVNKIFGEIK